MALPTTIAEILATATINPDFAEAIKEKPPPFHPGITISALKSMINVTLPTTQATLAASRPPTISEATHFIPTRDGALNRTIICRPAAPLPQGSPVIILLHGGGHCFGFPEMELLLARRLATSFSAICILPSYRLAPEFPSPTSFHDCWDTLQWVAREASTLTSANPSLGFLIGGTSAGGGIASSLAHLARDTNLSPPLTGQMNCIGSVMHPDHVPAKYQPRYLSRSQNKDAPLLNERFHLLMRDARNPDPTSSLVYCFDQHRPDGNVAAGHAGLPPAYFQVCGLDMSRDDGLIYERVLREECKIPTRCDLYKGLPHGWWGMMPQLESSKRRMEDAVQGVGWLLSFSGPKAGEA